MKSSHFTVASIGLMLLLVLLTGLNRTPIKAQDTSPTPTPTLTETPTPTDDSSATADANATETSTPDGRVLIQVVARVAVFRTGPGADYPVIAQDKYGGKISLSGISQDGAWYVFPYSRRGVWINAWISGDTTITELLEGDPQTLPVIDTPPTPEPRDTSVPTVNDGSRNAQNCDFDNTMTVEQQDATVQSMYNAINANDWHGAGVIARGLYRRCTMLSAFYLLYTIYLPSSPSQGVGAPPRDVAFALFQQGWTGQ